MKWPWSKPEIRSSYTEAIVFAFQTLTTEEANTAGLGALETACALYRGVLCAADCGHDAVTASWMEQVATDLVRRGEHVSMIDVSSGRLMLRPAWQWDITGGRSWEYQVDMSTPSGGERSRIHSDGVVHLFWRRSRERPWEGVSPLSDARLTGKLSAGLERQLGNEANGLSGYLLPVPRDPQGGSYAPLQETIKKLSGNTAMAKTTAGGHGLGPGQAPKADWKTTRIGMQVHKDMVDLRMQVCMDVLQACGIPGALVASDANSQGQREAYRRWCLSVCSPLLKRIGEELTRKLETPIKFDLADTWSADWQGRASAVKALDGYPDAQKSLIQRLNLNA